MAQTDRGELKPKRLTAMTGLWLGVAFCIGNVLLILALSPILPKIDFAPDTGFDHYYWKLTDPTFWTRATAWGGYVLHQVSIWALIYYAQSGKLTYSKLLHPVNILAMAANGFFILLHLAQTHIWYDGLAQDTHIMTSQGSVILLLVMVLIMENQRRGLVFGAKAPFLKQAGQFLRKYHGYYFSWAVIYTFWYHPMEANIGHLLGTLYTTLIMLQGSLFFTKLHTNRYWTFLMETMVVIHGALVAAFVQNSAIWSQFLFGFLAVMLITQIHGIGLRVWHKAGLIAAYIAAVVAVYTSRGSLTDGLLEVIRIPFVEYGLVYIIAGLIWIGIAVAALASRRKSDDGGSTSGAEPAAVQSSYGDR